MDFLNRENVYCLIEIIVQYPGTHSTHVFLLQPKVFSGCQNVYSPVYVYVSSSLRMFTMAIFYEFWFMFAIFKCFTNWLNLKFILGH